MYAINGTNQDKNSWIFSTLLIKNKPHGLVIAPNLSSWDVVFEMHYTVTH